jgi:hypothetical protein
MDGSELEVPPTYGGIWEKNRKNFRCCYHEIVHLCYTHDMQPDRSCWEGWARTLQRWGVHEIVAALLESAGPLTILLAQFVYVGQPFLRGTYSGERLQALAKMFEDPQESRSFAIFLREDRIA